MFVRDHAIGRHMVRIWPGDITDPVVDAIANSENEDMKMDAPGGIGVSAAIRRRAGEEVARELARQRPAKHPMDQASHLLACAFLEAGRGHYLAKAHAGPGQSCGAVRLRLLHGVSRGLAAGGGRASRADRGDSRVRPGGAVLGELRSLRRPWLAVGRGVRGGRP